MDANDTFVMQLVAENDNICKADAPEHGMAVTTFHDHAKKLVAMGLLKEYPTNDKKGYPKTIYKVA